MRRLLLLVTLLAACHTSSAATPDALAELRTAITSEIRSNAQDAHHWQLARDAIAAGVLIGKSRAELEAALGPARACRACKPGDPLSWNVGRLPRLMDGGTPVLVVAFDARGVSVGASTVHEQ